MSFLGGGPGTGADGGTDVSQVTTPSQKDLGKQHALGNKEAGWPESFWSALWAGLIKGIEIIITTLVGQFDNFLALFVGLVTSAQGADTPGFWKLTSQIINDFIGTEITVDDLARAAQQGGFVAGMDKAGEDFFNVLINIFLGQGLTAKGGPKGLPGEPGTPLSPEQGFKGAAAFLGFILSFAIREGNLETISTILPADIRMFEGIRSYGRIMAKGLGFGRMSRRVLQPLLQETIIKPMQLALNKQYRPSVLDIKQIALALIRGDIDKADYKDRLALLGYTDTDIEVLLADTYVRLSLNDVYLLFSTGEIDEADFRERMALLGYFPDDVDVVKKARDLAAVQIADRAYAVLIANDLVAGTITQGDYESAVDDLRLPRIEIDALTRNAVRRKVIRHKHLTVGFLKKAYLEKAITLDEYLTHVADLGYSQDDIDILEQELLIEQKAEADKLKAAAEKAAAKAKKTTTPLKPAPGG